MRAISCALGALYFAIGFSTAHGADQVSELSKEPMIGILVGEGRGGFGDVASGLLMAQNINRLDPRVQIVITCIPNSSCEPFYNMLAAKSSQVLQIASPSSRAGQPHIMLGFSAKTVPSAIESPWAFIFGEYDWHQPNHTTGEIKAHHYSIPTGFETDTFYFTEETPAIPEREKTLEAVKNNLGLSNDIPKSALIGFSYQSQENANTRYILDIQRVIDADPTWNEGKRVVVFTNKLSNGNDFESLVGESNQNSKRKLALLEKSSRYTRFQYGDVDVITYKSLPLRYSEELIALSNIPINVTGDVSLTLALQYGKPFGYETHPLIPWKQTLFQNLMHAFPEMLTISKFDRLKSKDLWPKFSQQINQFRKGRSLPQYILEVVHFLHRYDAPHGGHLDSEQSRIQQHRERLASILDSAPHNKSPEDFLLERLRENDSVAQAIIEDHNRWRDQVKPPFSSFRPCLMKTLGPKRVQAASQTK